MEFNRKSGNIFEALVEKKVRQKVVQKQATNGSKPATQPPQKTQRQLRQEELLDEADVLLSTDPWKSGKHTYMLKLNNTVRSQNTRLWAHLTINKKDVRDRCGAARVNDDLATALDQIRFHVTFEENDDTPARDNPRWYSDNRGWQVQGYHAGLDALAEATAIINEARGIRDNLG